MGSVTRFGTRAHVPKPGDLIVLVGAQGMNAGKALLSVLLRCAHGSVFPVLSVAQFNRNFWTNNTQAY